MPVIWRGDGNGINILILEKLPNIAVGLNLDAVFLQARCALVQNLLVDVAQGNEPYSRHFLVSANVIAAATVKAHYPDTDIPIRAGYIEIGGSGWLLVLRPGRHYAQAGGSSH